MNRKADPERNTPVADREREPGLLRRWSQRKAQARALQQESPSAPARATTTPVLTDADMPPIESLDGDSDYSVFFSPGVSEALRQRALQKLFHSGLFNERCPLDGEYYDCRGTEPLGSVITHEMREEMERAAAKLKERAQAALVAEDEQSNMSSPVIDARPAADPPPRSRKHEKSVRREIARSRSARRPRGHGA
jgi:hypothetical protein